jgi:hypothetical protein
MPIFKFDKKKLTHCIGGSMSVHIIMKTSSNVENILGFNGIYIIYIISIVTFLMTTYKFVFLDNFLYDFFPCNCRSSVRMSLKYWWRTPEYPKERCGKSFANFITHCSIEYTSPWTDNFSAQVVITAIRLTTTVRFWFKVD